MEEVKDVEVKVVNDDELMTSAEVCDFLKISKKTLSNWIYSKNIKIPIYRVGGAYRFKRKDVKSLIVEVK